MTAVLAKAVRDRKRPLRHDLRIGYGLQTLRVPAATTAAIVRDARRRYRLHNAGRRYVEQELFAALAESSRTPLELNEAKGRLRNLPEVREALERMWPVLTPVELLHDLYGSRALLRLAGRGKLDDDEIEALHRPRVDEVADIVWTADDVPLLDEARALLGATPKGKKRGDEDELRTYGHIVVDEAQDLSPMQLRMLSRRSLNGSMTVVGDIAQSTGAWAHSDWDEILARLPERREPRRTELTVGYRIPAPNMALATRVLVEAAPNVTPPRSVREDGREPLILGVATPDELGAAVVGAVTAELSDVGVGNLAVITPWSLAEPMSRALTEAGIEHGTAVSQGLSRQVTVVPVGMVKGLELDATVVVEPAGILDEEAQGWRALYVALTRATKLLTIVHSGDLPAVLAPVAADEPATHGPAVDPAPAADEPSAAYPAPTAGGQGRLL
jgi:DNA helicase IV